MIAPERVLHLIDTGGPGGAETVLASIVESLPGDSWQSRVIVPTDDWLFGRLREQKIDAQILKSKRAADIPYLGTLVRIFREFRPALVHTHLLASGVYGSLAAAVTGGVPLLCTFHGKPDVKAADRLLRVKARLLCRSSNRIVYVSQDLRRHLEPLMGIPERLGVMIHNGVAFSRPRPSPLRRLEAGGGPGLFLVGAVGNIREPKDYPNLLRAAAIVCRQRGDVRFAIAGGGGDHLMQRLRAMLVEFQLCDRVRFLGFQDNVAELISIFDLFVSSSSSEGLPLSTLEAMGMGKPVVLTRCGGPAEIVDDGRTGILVPPREPRALAMAILAVLADPERRHALAVEGAKEVQRRFSRERMLEDYQSVYRDLIQRHPISG